MNKFRDVLQGWQSLPVNVAGSWYKLQEVKDDYIKLTKTGEDGLTDTTYIPLSAMSSIVENQFKKGQDKDFNRYIYLG